MGSCGWRINLKWEWAKPAEPVWERNPQPTASVRPHARGDLVVPHFVYGCTVATAATSAALRVTWGGAVATSHRRGAAVLLHSLNVTAPSLTKATSLKAFPMQARGGPRRGGACRGRGLQKERGWGDTPGRQAGRAWPRRVKGEKSASGEPRPRPRQCRGVAPRGAYSTPARRISLCTSCFFALLHVALPGPEARCSN